MKKTKSLQVSDKALSPEALEKVILNGDLAVLTPAQRVSYYQMICESVGLNPLTKPFDYLQLNGKTVLYANKNCAEQLRKNHGISITKLETKVAEGVYIVTANAKDSTNREDSSTGAVNIKGLFGDTIANAFMKAETKAKRRATLSICGLGMLDESEVSSIKDARPLSAEEVDALLTINTAPPSSPPINQNLNNPWDFRLPMDWKKDGGEQLRTIGAERVSKLVAGLKKLKKPNESDKEILFYASAALKVPLAPLPEDPNFEADWNGKESIDVDASST